jgi:hypothetical protein
MPVWKVRRCAGSGFILSFAPKIAKISWPSEAMDQAMFDTAYHIHFSTIVPRAVEDLGGWTMASVGLLRTGVSETILIGTNTAGNGNFTNQRPNAVLGMNPYVAGKGADKWFNPAAFSVPAQGMFGNLARNTVFGPALAQIDVSLLKDFRCAIP